MSGTGRHCFLSASGELLPRWREAFPDAMAMPIGLSARTVGRPVVIWVRLPGDREADQLLAMARSLFSLAPLVVLSDHPDDDEALACLAAGALGYCNSHAAPAVLRQVADTVLRDGLWIGASLMRRWRAALTRIGDPGWAAAEKI